MSPAPLAVCYARLPVADMDAAGRFMTEFLGLPPGPAPGDIRCFRASQRQNEISILPAGSAEAACGIEFADRPALDLAVARLVASGFDAVPADAGTCRERQVDAAILARDATGNAVDLVLRPHMNGRRCHLLRDSGITGLHGFGLRSTDIGRDLAFWEALGGQVADQVGDITYLRLDGAHHRVALYPSDRPGLLYIAFAVEGLDQLMQAAYHAAGRQVRVLQGPGRQTASGLAFLHLQGPDGFIVTLVAPSPEAPVPHRVPRRFRRTVDGLCAWGSICEEIPELRAEEGP